MSVLANFSLPAEEFPLGELLEVRPGVKVRLETLVPTGEAVIPYFWIRSPDIEAAHTALERSPLVKEVRLVDEIGDEGFFRVKWAEGVNGFISSITDNEAAVVQGTGHGDEWSFQLRFGDHDTLSEFFQDIQNKGVDANLVSVLYPGESSSGAERLLTDQQREALQLALDEGYFAVPREVTLEDLSETLGVSDSAVSQRIRRGLNHILSSALKHE